MDQYSRRQNSTFPRVRSLPVLLSSILVRDTAMCLMSFMPYVYAMSNDGSWETGDHVFMARVHKDSILDRKAWQFLSSVSDKNIPTWSNQEDESSL